MPPDQAAGATIEALNEAIKEVGRAYDLLAKAGGLSDPEFWSLDLIYHGAQTQREIAERLYLSPQTLNSAFKLLVKKGLVELTPFPHDQRSKRAALTAAGRAFVEEKVLPLEGVEAKAWAMLAPEEQAALVGLTRRFGGALRRCLQLHTQSSEDL